MIELMQKIKETAERSSYNHRIGYLLQRMHLQVATDQESKELDEWIYASEVNDQLFDLFLDYFHSTSFDEIKSLLVNPAEHLRKNKAKILEQKYLGVAAYATNLNPRTIALIGKCLKGIATEEETKLVCAWMNESKPNDVLYDLLLDAKFDDCGVDPQGLLAALPQACCNTD